MAHFLAIASFSLNVMIDLLICNSSLEELERDADEEQIKVAYRRLAKFYHPDGVSLIFCSLFLMHLLCIH